MAVETNETSPAHPFGHLRRSVSDRWITGLASGIAARLGLAPIVVRVAFVALALTGVGAPLYAFLSGATRRDDDPGDSDFADLARGAVAGIAVAYLQLWSGLRGIPWAIVPLGLLGALILLWNAPWRGARWLAALAGLAALAAVFGVGASSPVVMGDGVAIGTPDSYGPGFSTLVAVVLVVLGAGMVVGRSGANTIAMPAGARIARPRPSGPSTLLLLALGVATAAATVTALALASPDGLPHVGAGFAAGAIVLGLAAVLGGIRGRSRLLVPLALVAGLAANVPTLMGIRVVNGNADPGVLSGEAHQVYHLRRTARPVTITQEAVEQGLRSVRLEKGLGTVTVNVAENVPLDLVVRELHGGVNVYDELNGTYFYAPGQSLASHAVSLPARDASVVPTVHLDIRGGFTDVQVVRVRSAESVAADVTAREALLARERAAFEPLVTAQTAALRTLRATSIDFAPALRGLAGHPELTEGRTPLDGVTPEAEVDPVLMALDDALRARIDRIDALLTGVDPASLTEMALPERDALQRLDERSESWPTDDLAEESWTFGGDGMSVPTSARTLDPRLSALIDARAARYEVLRAHWRITSIERGIADLKGATSVG